MAVDVDVHKHPTWWTGWPRPLGICQWTLSSAPNHPIFIDAARRVVNATRVVKDWENWRQTRIAQLELEQPEGWKDYVTQIRELDRRDAMEVMVSTH